MRCQFRRKRWKIVEAPPESGGECQGPHVKERTMTVPISGDTLQDLDTCVHEALHACLWDIEEHAIYESALDIARFLWRLGWRKE